MSEPAPLQPRLDTQVFIISLVTLLVTTAVLIIMPEQAQVWAEGAMNWLTHNFGWLYLLSAALPLGFSFWLAFGRFGHIKLGAVDEKPEYSTASWIGLMFTASMGASLIAWGFAEPIFYIQTPPLGVGINTPQASELAHMYPLFH